MTNRAALSALLAALLIVPATAGLADTYCDLLSTTNKASKVEQVLCQPCPAGPPVPGGRVGGFGLDYVTADGKRWQCELFRGNNGTGDCKKLTTCLPGGERFFDNGIYKCRYEVTLPGPSNPRESCERGLPLAISSVDDGHSLHSLVAGQNVMFVKGTGAGNATSGEMTGGITVTVGELFRRLGSSSVCLPPNCQDVKLIVPQSAVGSDQTLTLYTPHRYKSATASLHVNPPAQARIANGGSPVLMVKGSAPGASPTPTPQPAHNQSYSAGLGCPGGQTSSTNVLQSGGPSPVFEVRNPQGVQATAAAIWINTRVPGPGGSVQVCSWTEAYQFKITARDGQGDVTVSWLPMNANPPGQNMGGTRTVTLAKGKWQIVPDATFPPDFTYTVSFRD